MKIFFHRILLLLAYFAVMNVGVLAQNHKVEDLFIDIDSDYIYLLELQTLYDKGMIEVPIDKKFSPHQLLKRDDFVGMLMELSCEKCMQPYTPEKTLEEYKDIKLFFDITKQNKNYYCIAEGEKKGYIQGYEEGSSCNDGTNKEGEKPFCPNNTINLQEALAIVMRVSGIMTLQQAALVEQEILNGRITDAISDDVSPINGDGSVNSFYPYLEKALGYEILEFDIYGNKYNSILLEKTRGKIYPNKNISKQDFLRIAYIALKSNSCKKTDSKEVPLSINILSNKCSYGGIRCDIALNPSDNIFDFHLESGSNSTLIQPKYLWRLYHPETHTYIYKQGDYLDNQLFQYNGKWNIIATIEDEQGNIGKDSMSLLIKSTKNSALRLQPQPCDSSLDCEQTGIGDFPRVYNIYPVNNNNGDKFIWTINNQNSGFSQVIESYFINDFIFTGSGVWNINLKEIDKKGKLIQNTDSAIVLNDNGTPIVKDIFLNFPKNTTTKSKQSEGFVATILATNYSGASPLVSYFTAEIFGGESPYRYSWDFGDGNRAQGSKVEHTFLLEGDYNVSLSVTDANGDTVHKTMIISVESIACAKDEDGDGVMNCNDLCPNIFGDKNNNGCPIFETGCKSDSDCGVGFFCGTNYFCQQKQLSSSCEYLGGNFIIGNAVCNTCPCDNFLDFNDQLRRCDIIFPAITSLDNKEIYNKGKYFQIK